MLGLGAIGAAVGMSAFLLPLHKWLSARDLLPGSRCVKHQQGGRQAKLTLLGMERDIYSSCYVDRSDIQESWDDIGGLDAAKAELRQRVIRPLTETTWAANHLLRLTSGVLLSGPPGTGKTMLAKALAMEGRLSFLNVRASAVMDQYYGNSNKKVAAVFSLAAKLQPCIIFIDEADALLGARNMTANNEVTASMKTEFLQLWQGLLTQRMTRILVLAATNLPQHLDAAAVRRFGVRIEIPKPDEEGRVAILAKELHDTEREGAAGALLVDPDFLVSAGEYGPWLPAGRDLGASVRDIARRCGGWGGFSGSDLKQLAEKAAHLAVQEHESALGAAVQRGPVGRAHLAHRHFDDALKTVRPAGWFADGGTGGSGAGAVHQAAGDAPGGPHNGGRPPPPPQGRYDFGGGSLTGDHTAITPPRPQGRSKYMMGGGLPAGRDGDNSGRSSNDGHRDSDDGSGSAGGARGCRPANGTAPVGGSVDVKLPGNSGIDAKLETRSDPPAGVNAAKQLRSRGTKQMPESQKPTPRERHEPHAFGVAHAAHAFSGPGPVAPSPAHDRPPPRRTPGRPAVHSSN